MTQKKSTKRSYNNPDGGDQISSGIAANLKLKFERYGWDVLGLALLAISVMTLLVLLLPQLAEGKVLELWTNLLRRWLGWGSLFVALASGILGVVMLRWQADEDSQVPWGRIFALEGSAFAALILMTLFGEGTIEKADSGLEGGLVGWGLAELINTVLPSVVSIIILLICLVVFLILGLGLENWIFLKMRKIFSGQGSSDIDTLTDPAVSVAPAATAESKKSSVKSSRSKPVHVAPEYRKSFRVESQSDKMAAAPVRNEKLPPLEILIQEKDSQPDERHINQRAGLIEQTLAEFGVPVKVISFQVGPTVTQFAVEPGFIEKPGATDEEIARLRKVRVSQISNLARDLALSLSAERLRVQAPVPGRPYVGIEVPNARSAIVRLRSILETDAFYKIGTPLTIALGRDVSGNPVVADLSTMPHLLIAGTTGSGKSVCIAAFTTCLAMNNTPEELRLVMIDPKMVELVRFNGLPHLYGKVETDIDRILGVLRWVVSEMDNRYIVLEQSRSRNIDTYNRKMRRRKDGKILPRIVVMIDELADLMISAPEATEHNLVRLAQMARAVGIHLVVATQRPSTDVVTGLIKANFPARMSFAVASSVDSRVILDTPGAEHLLGRGDMLFLPPEVSSPVRVQGVWVTDQEVEKTITFWQKSYPLEDGVLTPWDEMLDQEAVLANRDELLEKAVRLIARTQKASASMLQRQLRIGYPRAARLMDELEELGVVGPGRGGGRVREILIDPDADVNDVL